MTHNRVTKLERLAADRLRPSAAAARLDAEFRAVLARWRAAVPADRRERVRDVIEGHAAARRADPGAPPPSLVDWVDWLGFPHGAWFPDPIPAALLDAYLDHPEADAGGYQCGGCGVMAPTRPASGAVGSPEFRNVSPVFAACPHCGGAVGWFAHRNRTGGDTLPHLGAELLAGRDPIGKHPTAPRRT